MLKKNTKDSGALPDRALPGTGETWNLVELRWHPRQDENFHPLGEDDLARLAEDLKLNGQRTPIEVTPDGRIIDGHQRWRAATMLGWTAVLVIVRHDLAGDEAAIERRMIEANLNRRQLDALDRVRLARRMLEIKRKVKPGGLSQYAEQDLRDRIGEMLNMSGRNVQRYMNILNAPMVVQRAYSEGALSMKLAEKVARLDEAARVEIVGEIADGGDPAGVVAAHLPAASPVEAGPDLSYEAFLVASGHAVGALGGRVDRVRGGADLASEIEVLKRAASLIDRLVDRLKVLQRQRAKAPRGVGMPGA